MIDLLSVSKIFIVIGNYQLSYIEFIGTILYFVSVLLISRKSIITWPIGIVSVILYGILFYQIQLYSDMMEQFYYLIISIVGWYQWYHQKQAKNQISTSWSKLNSAIFTIIITIILTGILTICVSNFHKWMPAIFPVPASYPFLDALTTMMSFTAMLLTTRRKNEGWIYWIIIDIIGICLYWIKDVKFISLQYVFLLAMAIYGLANWYVKSKPKQEN